jgi:hypothetical protein
MKKTTTTLMIVAIMLLLTVVGADAATSKFTGLPVDDIAVKFFDSLVNVWIPIIAMVALIGLVVNMFVGFVQIGAKVVGFCFGIALLAGGLPVLSTIFGGKLATALVLIPLP